MSDAEGARPPRSHRTNAVQRALAHPTRARILTELQKAPASPSALAEVVGETVGVTSYHVRILAEAGLVELVRSVPKRGAIQHFYAAKERSAVGVTLRLDEATALALERDIRALVDRARAESEGRPGDVMATVVVHVERDSPG